MNSDIKEKIELIKEKKVPNGYKKSQVGVIPTEWNIRKLNSINTISTGLTPLRSKIEYFEGSIFWVKTTDLNNSNIYDTEEKITEIAMNETSLKYVEENSILIAMYGGFNQIGRTGLMKIKGTTNQAISSFHIDEKEYNSQFILQWLNANRFYWRRLAASSRKDPNITKKDVEDFPIVKIPYLEQKRIAGMISIWDKNIELKENLLKERLRYKKGLMEILLTGKSRLSGFNEEVKFKKLKSYINEIKIKNKENKEKRILSVTNKQGFILQEEQFDRIVASSDVSNYKIVKKGQFAYNPSRVNVGSLDLLTKFESGLLSPMYVIFECNDKLNKDYLHQFLKSNMFLNVIPRLLQGSVRDSLSFEALQQVKLFIPKLEEQRAIAKILKTSDKEIDLLKKEIELLKEQKKGLMQLLLTGIVRV
ncbi:restriction endonuclease subunit S [Terrisporobacter petrolearius]|uniref:restriction endonuclease subunit S n=1 Tax=Terrisporobacter petrolearius TaxID=1460447 RepID=UPI003AFFE07F